MPHNFWSRQQPAPAPTNPPQSSTSNQQGQHPFGANFQPNNAQQPFRSDDPNGELYQMPGYRYPHTLSFLDHFTPEIEGQIIDQFHRASSQLSQVPLPLARSFNASFRSEGENVDQTGGWAQFADDLDEMGLGPIVDAIGLTRAPKASRRISFVNEAGVTIGSTHPTAPKISLNPGLATENHPRHGQAPTRQPRHRPAGTGMMDVDGPSYAAYRTGPPVDPLWYEDCDAKTEVDPDYEEEGERWLRQMATGTSSKNPYLNPRSAFGPGFTVGRDLNGQLCGIPIPKYVPSRGPRSDHSDITWMAPENLVPQGHDGGVKYPSLPTMSSSGSSTGTVIQNPQPGPSAQPMQNRHARHHSTPGGYLPSYHARRPNDTVFHHGSAGVNPLGAHARGVQKAAAARGESASACARRHHRVVSGSFGSFETRTPSRFDERRYRLFLEQKKDGQGGNGQQE